MGYFIKKDNPFGLDRTLGLVLICINFSSNNKHLVLSCRLSETSDNLQDNLQVWYKTVDNLNNSV